MDSLTDCKLYFVYDTKRDYYVEIYTDKSACESSVNRMNEYSKRDGLHLRYAVAYSTLGELLLDLRNGKL